MLYTIVVPCLSSGFVVLFSQVFGYFENSAFSQNKGVKPHIKAVKRDVCSQFLKAQQLSQFF